ncbi:hypothetical protein [Leptolyngbya sp. KIOST-1]|nr:hypothetical protein [Leptolyngbya sp. KIOST-1]
MAPGEAEQLRAEAAFLVASQDRGSTLRDALGCSCATCQSTQRQTLF